MFTWLTQQRPLALLKRSERQRESAAIWGHQKSSQHIKHWETTIYRSRSGGIDKFHAFRLALLQLPCEERQLRRCMEFHYPKDHTNWECFGRIWDKRAGISQHGHVQFRALCRWQAPSSIGPLGKGGFEERNNIQKAPSCSVTNSTRDILGTMLFIFSAL